MNDKEIIKEKALALWQELCESNMPYADFLEVQEYIITLFNDIN